MASREKIAFFMLYLQKQYAFQVKFLITSFLVIKIGLIFNKSLTQFIIIILKGQNIMASLVATGMCCCFSCCCQECSQGAKRWLGPERVTKIFYFFLVVIYVVPAIFIFFFLNKWKSFITYFSQWISCPQSSGTDQFGCIGQSVVFRLSLSLLILFTLMLIFMLFRSRLSMVVNEGCFCFKYLLVIAALIGFLWVDDKVFNNFAQFSKYASILYMLLQSIILIDLFYLAGIKLVKRYDQGQTQYACYLIILSIIVEGIAIGLNVWGYILFSKNTDTCSNTVWVNVITSIILVILPVVQFLHFNVQNSLLTTALVSMFISYLAFIGQFSFGDNVCIRMDVGSLIGDILCSTFFFVLTMYGSIMGGTGQVKVTRDGNLNAAMGVAQTQPVDQEQNPNKYMSTGKNNSNENMQTQQQNELKYTNSWQWAKWHFYMCIASIYVSMLITNWISVNVTTGEIKSSNFGFWVRVTISWATFLLYLWTLIAPRVCPGRDFIVQ